MNSSASDIKFGTMFALVATVMIAFVPGVPAQPSSGEGLEERNAAASRAFLVTNRAMEGVRTTESGLQYKVLKLGTGEKPAARDQVTVHYTGTLTDGKKFDSSVDRGQPAKLNLETVIKGWAEGVRLMPTGSRFVFFIPPELGYGTKAPPIIGPSQVLVFDVELLAIEPGGVPAAPNPQKRTAISQATSAENGGPSEVAADTSPSSGVAPEKIAAESFGRGMQLLAKGDESGVKALEVAGESGHLEAQWRLGAFYSIGGRTIKMDVRKAEEWLLRAATNGAPEAYYLLGDLEKIPKYGRQNLEKARLWYQKSADKGFALAQLELGTFHASGVGGAQQSWSKAAEMFEKASSQGIPDAKFRLSLCYLNGVGVPQNLEKSVRLMDEAASQNHPAAQQWFEAPSEEALLNVHFSGFMQTWLGLFAQKQLRYLPKAVTRRDPAGIPANGQPAQERQTCTLCNGSGTYGREAVPNYGNGPTSFRNKTCSKCNGTGRVYY